MSSTNKLKVLDLFSGIGGFSYGLDRTGDFETVAFCEIDPHAQKVLKKNFPGVPIFEDVSTLTKGKLIAEEGIWDIDVICGGFPCQDISVAGKQKGINENTRSGLWFQYKRLIAEIKPRWVIIENVRNLLSNGFATVLQDLHEVGYDAEWEIISARSVGACHLRERIWIVAYPNGKSVRVGTEREEEGRNYLQQPEESESGHFSSDNDIATSDSESKRVQGLWPSGEQIPYSHGEEEIPMRNSEVEPDSVSDSHDFRFWPSFTSEEEKQLWWTEATSSIRNWWEVESSVCRVDDGLPPGLDKGRAQRIKQLGNSIVPPIAEIIGRRILHHEAIMEL